MGMSVADIRNEVEAVNYDEVKDRIQALVEDEYSDFIQTLVDEEGGSIEDKIIEMFEEMIDHRIDCLQPTDNGLF